jgi:16S rRNA G966 N2-methylase RsmD
MLLYDDYFMSESSPSPSSFIYNSLSNPTVYDIIFLPPSYAKQHITEEYLSTLSWLDKRLVSIFKKKKIHPFLLELN